VSALPIRPLQSGVYRNWWREYEYRRTPSTRCPLNHCSFIQQTSTMDMRDLSDDLRRGRVITEQNASYGRIAALDRARQSNHNSAGDRRSYRNRSVSRARHSKVQMSSRSRSKIYALVNVSTHSIECGSPPQSESPRSRKAIRSEMRERRSPSSPGQRRERGGARSSLMVALFMCAICAVTRCFPKPQRPAAQPRQSRSSRNSARQYPDL